MKQMSRKKRKVTLLDLLIVLLFLLSVAAAFARWQSLRSLDKARNEGTLYRLEFESVPIDPRVADCVAVGDTVCLSDGRLLGTVAEKRAESYREEICRDGVFYTVQWDRTDRCKIVLVVEGMCKDSERALLVSGGTPLGIGEEITLSGRSFLISCRFFKGSAVMS